MTAEPVPFAALAHALRVAHDQELAGIEASARYGLAPSARDNPEIARILAACLEQNQKQARLLMLAHAWLLTLAPHEHLVRALVERPDVRELVAGAIRAPAAAPLPIAAE
jgi:hypothetical protein